MLYLDNSATTQMLPEVKDAMLPFLLEEFGNPSSKYYSLANTAQVAVEESRNQIAKLVGCLPDEIIFTSGATESNNMIIKGVADSYGVTNKHIVTTAIEHPSILETVNYLESKGFRITYLQVNSQGLIDINHLQRIISEDPPFFVSIIWGNNETGSLQPIEELSKICSTENILFHTDATQVISKLPINLTLLQGVSFLSLSAHKFHGPKGIGAAVIRKDHNNLKRKLTPLLHGGGQESGYRSGTLAVPNIVGFGKAAEVAYNRLTDNIAILQQLEKDLTEILSKKFRRIVKFNHPLQNKIPGIMSVQFKDINNETLLKRLANNIAMSTGSACSSTKPSYVLQAIGLSPEEIRSTIRISLSAYQKTDDLKLFNAL